MKYYKTQNLNKASNVTFNVKTIEAYSYSWWAFVKVIKGKVVFNKYRYSVSTSKHQSKVRSLLSQLDIKIDRFVQCKDGLQHINTIKTLNEKENETLKRIAEREAAKKQRQRERARARYLAKKQSVLTSEAQS